MPENKPKMTEQIRRELKELTDSISVMMSTFRQIKQPMQESSDKLPTTTSQLERVTEQTEHATHKMLDIVENISNRETEISESIQKVKTLIPEDVLNGNEELTKLIDTIVSNSEVNINDSYGIMDALQFQDITTQQIDHAISLLDDVEEKLHTMLKAVGIKQQAAAKAPRKKAFDPNARFPQENPKQQADIDQIISNLK